MKNWYLWLSKPGTGKLLRAGSIILVASMFFIVLAITSGVLAAPDHRQTTMATNRQTPTPTLTNAPVTFKQQLVTSPAYIAHQGVREYTQSCPSGTILTGGGYRLLKGRPDVTFLGSYPSTTTSSAWAVIINNPSPNDATFQVYVVCLSVQQSALTPPNPTPVPTP
ncbi:MAG: hypothetical protein NVSMB44_23420 [Ktedonobacteraceae bacterium]